MNRIRMGILALLASNIFLVAHAQKAPEVHSFSVKECLDYSRSHNVQVKNALLDLQIQEQTNKSITAGALPTITATGSSTDFLKTPVTLVPAQFFGGTPGTYMAVSFQPQYSASGIVQLTQTIFDGQVFVGLQARKASIDYYQKSIDLTRESIGVNIYKIYYQLVVSKTQMKQLDANIARAQKLLDDTKVLYANGFVEKLDIDRVTVQLANLQTQKQLVLTNIDNGYLALKYLLGMPVKDSLILSENFSEDDLKSGMLSDTAYRYEDRNDYQLLGIAKSLGEYNIKRYKYSYLPTASINAAYQKNALGNTYDFFTQSGIWFTTAYVGLNINVPIFSGFSKNANLKKARLQLIQTQNQIDNLKNAIDNEVAQSQNKFRSDVLTVDFQRKNMSLAESVYNQTKKKYESGLASNTDITNAQTDLITAQTSFITALYDAVIAKVDYQKAIGKLNY
ncbi:MAG: TolC family protein [Bacteroidetes bacterium]|nr:TolC family protein [Bacteroidota bacterium]